MEFETTMTKLTLMSTFWLLIGAAMIFGTPMDPTEQVPLKEISCHQTFKKRVYAKIMQEKTTHSITFINFLVQSYHIM